MAKVLKVKRYPFHGFVYDLQTFSGLYTCGGIITYNCRCRVVPVAKSIDSVVPGYQPPKGSRSSMDGEVPGTVTWEEWLAAKEAVRPGFARGILGRTRYDLWKAGKAKLGDFTTGGRLLTLDQLRRKLAGAAAGPKKAPPRPKAPRPAVVKPPAPPKKAAPPDPFRKPVAGLHAVLPPLQSGWPPLGTDRALGRTVLVEYVTNFLRDVGGLSQLGPTTSEFFSTYAAWDAQARRDGTSAALAAAYAIWGSGLKFGDETTESIDRLVAWARLRAVAGPAVTFSAIGGPSPQTTLYQGLGTAIHEAVHQFSHGTYATPADRAMEEGLTEALARRLVPVVMTGLYPDFKGSGIERDFNARYSAAAGSSGAYPRETQMVEAVVGLVSASSGRTSPPTDQEAANLLARWRAETPRQTGEVRAAWAAKEIIAANMDKLDATSRASFHAQAVAIIADPKNHDPFELRRALSDEVAATRQRRNTPAGGTSP